MSKSKRKNTTLMRFAQLIDDIRQSRRRRFGTKVTTRVKRLRFLYGR